jgi:hypothetical protein
VPNAARNFETAKARLSYAAAVLHTIDLDGLARVHGRLASPQALLDGIPFATQLSAENWLAIVEAALTLRDASRFDDDALAAVEANLPAPLQPVAPPRFEPGDELVDEAFACPGCGERRVDELQVTDDSAVCLTCGIEFNLPEVGR